MPFIGTSHNSVLLWDLQWCCLLYIKSFWSRFSRSLINGSSKEIFKEKSTFWLKYKSVSSKRSTELNKDFFCPVKRLECPDFSQGEIKLCWRHLTIDKV